VWGLLPFVFACGAPERTEAPPAAAAAPAAAPAATTPPASSERDYAVVGEAPCTPLDDMKFICNMVSPEDIAVFPGGEWAIASGNRKGGRLHLINVRAKTATVVFPAEGHREQLDAERYPICPGPLVHEKPDAFTAHGLYLKPGANGRHALYVVHHGTRESIEVFDVDSRATPPSLTWVGCAPGLSTHTFNSVVALPEGGLAATNTRAGDVWEYHKETGWRRIPGTEKTAPNGLEISKDGRTLYIAGWAEEKVTRVSRGRTPVQSDVIALGFRPDNIRFSADSSVLFAAGHTDKDGRSITEPRTPLTETINIARIDPKTLEQRRIFVHKAIPGFVAATTAVPIGDELWLGSNRGDRVAYLPLPK
jgi:hypothetical protein